MAQPFPNGFSRVDPSFCLEKGRMKNRSGASRLWPILLWKWEQVKERMTQLGIGVLAGNAFPGSDEKGEALAWQ